MATRYEFDEDTELQQVGELRYEGALSDRWNIGRVPNGGYVLSVAFRGAQAMLPHPDVLTLSAHYVAPTAPGPLVLEGELVHAGRSSSCAMLRLLQEGKERARFLATAGHFIDPAANLADHSESGPPPELPPRERCVRTEYVRGLTPRIAERFETHHAPESAAWQRGEIGGPLLTAAWIRFADGREPDAASLALFADALHPPLFSRYGMATWVPTLQLNVQFRRAPAPGFLRAAFRTRHFTGGQLEEDGEIWDTEDRIVALSRQLARVRMPG